MPPPLDKITYELRLAILAGDHSGAGRLVLEYVEALRQVWEFLPAHERATSEIPKQALELLTWARTVTITQRVLAGEQLGIVEKVIRYRAAAPPEARPGTIELSI